MPLSPEQDSARAAARKQSWGIRDVVAPQGCEKALWGQQGLFQTSPPQLQCSKLMFGGQAKKHPTNQISWKMPRAEQASSSRGAQPLPVQRHRGEREPRKRKKTKREQTNPNALTLPSARAEPPPGTSLPSSSVCHLTEGRSPNLPFLLLPTWDGPTCPVQELPTPLVLGEVQKPRTAQGK